MDKFFTWITRAASSMFLVLLFGIGGLIVYGNIDDGNRNAVTVAAETPQGEDEPQPLILGDVDGIAGSDVLMVKLGLDDNSFKGSGYGMGQVRNLLFLAGEGKEAAWLFKDNHRLVREIDQLAWGAGREDFRPTIALYMEYAELDSDGDERIDHHDDFTVALVRPDGSGITDILRNVKRVISHRMMDEKTLALVYQSGTHVVHARYRVDTFAKLSEQAVIEVPEAL